MRIRLRYQLFLIILLANLLLTVVMVWGSYRVFHVGFSEYVAELQRARLSQLIDWLVEEYDRYGSWEWIAGDTRSWQRLQRPHAMPRSEGRSGTPRSPGRWSVLQLRDAQGQPVVGVSRSAYSINWLAIEHQGQRIGELGVPEQRYLPTELDQVFAAQQRRQTLWVAGFALLLSALVAIPAAYILTRPILRLRHATRQLAQGHHAIQLPVRGTDELADLARDFNQLARTLERNLQARQRWIADISHELRTPISVLKAELEALQDGLQQPDAATLDSLHQEIERLSALVADLHELSLSDVGALSYQMQPLDFTVLVQQVIEQHTDALARHCIECRVALPEQPVRLFGDGKRLRQLLTNLMHNSLKYTDGTATQPGCIQITLRVQAGTLELVWADSPPGVPEHALPHLLERLYRLEVSRNRARGGSGLGLAIVHNIVLAHQGQITAQNSPLGGLQLIIGLPLTV
jgi:two-component system sensor histidine kinase BaeS